MRGAQGPHRSQRQAPPRLLAVGYALRVIPRITRLRESPAATHHVGGVGSLCSDPIRHRSGAGDAERQAQALPELRIETHRVKFAARAGRWLASPVPGVKNPKTKTFLRR